MRFATLNHSLLEHTENAMQSVEQGGTRTNLRKIKPPICDLAQFHDRRRHGTEDLTHFREDHREYLSRTRNLDIGEAGVFHCGTVILSRIH